MHAAPDIKKDAAQIHSLVERLSGLRETCTDPFEMAEINVQCTLTFYRLGENAQAVRLLADTEKTYQPHRHYTAVELWMKVSISAGLPWQFSNHFNPCGCLILINWLA